MRRKATVLALVTLLVLFAGAAWADDGGGTLQDYLDVFGNEMVFTMIGNDVDVSFTSPWTTVEWTYDVDYSRSAEVNGSLAGASGVVTLQMSPGSANILSSNVGVDGNFVAGDSNSISIADNGYLADVFVGRDIALSLLGIETWVPTTWDEYYTRTDHIGNGSLAGSSGIVTAQLSSGTGNVLALAVGVEAGEGAASRIDVLYNYDTWVFVADGVRVDATVIGPLGLFSAEDGYGWSPVQDNEDWFYTRKDIVDGGALDGAQGIVGVQMSSGTANVLNSAVNVVVRSSSGAGVTVAENEFVYAWLVKDVDAGLLLALTGIEYSWDWDYIRTDQILGSFNGASGIVTAQLSSGTANVLSSNVKVENFSSSGTQVGVAGNLDSVVDVIVDAELDAVLAFTGIGTSTDWVYSRSDSIESSFGGAVGVISAQTSSGSANILSSTVKVGYGSPTP